MVELKGTIIRDKIALDLKHNFNELQNRRKLVIVQIGENPESDVYIKQKIKFAETIGVEALFHKIKADESEQKVIEILEDIGCDASVGGIIVQLPIPEGLNKRKILNTIPVSKDVDGLSDASSALLYQGDKNAMIPATARGIISLLDYYEIEIQGKHVCVIGRSYLVGRPLALALLNRNATVTVCHSHTKNLEAISRSADILVVCVGKKNFINQNHVRPGQVVIDVGIHKTQTGLCGDVNRGEVEAIVSALSPVPGGVGPMTVVSLFQNFFDAQS